MTDDPRDAALPTLLANPDARYPLGAPVPPPAPEGGGGSEFPTLRRCISAVARRYRLLLIFMMLGGAVGYAATRFVQPKYKARATLWLEPSDPASINRGPIRTREFLDSYSWVDLLRSYSVLDPTAQSERLYLSLASRDADGAFSSFGVRPEFQPGEYELRVDAALRRYELRRNGAGVVENGAVGDPIGARLGLQWQPTRTQLRAGQSIRFTLVPIRDAATHLGEAIEPVMQEEGHFIRLELSDTDPKRAARVLNAVSTQFVTVASTLKRQQLEQLATILEEQLRYASERLQGEEQALERFRVETITLPSDRAMPVNPGIEATREPAFENFFKLNVERDQIRRDRGEIARVFADSTPGVGTLDALRISGVATRSPALTKALDDELTRRSALQALLLRYTPANPAVQRSQQELREVRGQIVGLVTELDRDLQAQEASLAELIGSASSTLRAIPPRKVEEARLVRRVDIAENLVKNLQARYEEARLAALSTLPDVRLQDRAAVPYAPESNPRMLILLGAVMASLGLGVLVAIHLDLSDNRFRDPFQITAGLQLPILGALPQLPKRAQVSLEDQSVGMEALRNARLNLLHAFGTAPPLQLTVSSPGAGDGKSFVTMNLAFSFAETGQRTILIDADLRRGRLHRALHLPGRPGLGEYLTGEATIGEILQQVPDVPHLYFVARGETGPETPVLLESDAMTSLLGALHRFQVVLIDSPPLGAAVDPVVLALHTRNLVLVMRDQVSDQVLAESKLAEIRRLPIRVLGAVLNGVPRTGAYRYYSYLDGYSTPVPRLAPASVPGRAPDDSDPIDDVLLSYVDRGEPPLA
jgi:capsular exopolysaccharide synthesis family protein